MELTAAQYRAYRKHGYHPDPIEFSEGNTKSTKLDTENPIMRIECDFSGSFNINGTGAELADGGILNAINRVQMRSGGDKLLFDVPGIAMPVVHQQYNRAAPYLEEIGVTDGDHDFEAHFSIPINATTAFNGQARFSSLLDAHNASSLSLITDWGQADDVAEGGTGGSTITSDGLVPRVVTNWHSQEGVPGGLNQPDALLHLITTDDVPITQDREALHIELDSARIHQRVTLMSISDGNLSDDIINSVGIGVGETQFDVPTAKEIQQENVTRYAFADKQTGFLIVDFMDPGFWEQMLTLKSSRTPRLTLNVSKPSGSTNNTVYVIYDRFIPQGT